MMKPMITVDDVKHLIASRRDWRKAYLADACKRLDKAEAGSREWRAICHSIMIHRSVARELEHIRQLLDQEKRLSIWVRVDKRNNDK